MELIKKNQCNKRFIDSSTLTNQKRTQTGGKPFKCDVCGKELIRSSNLSALKDICTQLV